MDTVGVDFEVINETFGFGNVGTRKRFLEGFINKESFGQVFVENDDIFGEIVGDEIFVLEQILLVIIERLEQFPDISFSFKIRHYQ